TDVWRKTTTGRACLVLCAVEQLCGGARFVYSASTIAIVSYGGFLDRDRRSSHGPAAGCGFALVLATAGEPGEGSADPQASTRASGGRLPHHGARGDLSAPKEPVSTAPPVSRLRIWRPGAAGSRRGPG